VAGTAAVDEHSVTVGVGDAAAQTRFIIGKIERALQACGAALTDVIRTRIFVTDISQWEVIGRAHGEAFGSIKPVTSMVQVGRLIGFDLLVEIEATAIVQEGGEP
jgi:enamine deaminase RidA (YjgF/YER057c/UK114 family)